MRCRLDDDDVVDDLKVYIRKVAPDAIEYAVGQYDKDFADFKGKVYRKVLR